MLGILATVAAVSSLAVGPPPNEARGQHPACWGATHVGTSMPTYVAGKDCLFCHRRDIAPSWEANAHRLTVRTADPESVAVRETQGRFLLAGELVGEVTAVMGKEVLRFLRPKGVDGQFSLLSAAWEPDGTGGGGLRGADDGAAWDDLTYARRCAGCHSARVETAGTFSAPSLDCGSCHGEVVPDHSIDTALVPLSTKRQHPLAVVSTCGSCHVRSGTSATTGRPYPNQFVPGDNLFRDLLVDWSAEALAEVNPIDRHVLENVRDVALDGKWGTTCLSCHSVHGQSTAAHRQLDPAPRCSTCHDRGGSTWVLRSYRSSSALCQYGEEWEIAEARRRARELEAEQLELFWLTMGVIEEEEEAEEESAEGEEPGDAEAEESDEEEGGRDGRRRDRGREQAAAGAVSPHQVLEVGRGG